MCIYVCDLAIETGETRNLRIVASIKRFRVKRDRKKVEGTYDLGEDTAPVMVAPDASVLDPAENGRALL